jgi:hypothetical protein
MKTTSSFVLTVPGEKNLDRAPVVAIQHVRPMRGGSQSQLMRASDQNLYVVKFRNNPQHRRVLANEMFAALLARIVGLPVPEPIALEVSERLIQHTCDLRIQLVSGTTPCEAGLQFGSRYAVNPLEGQVFDYLPTATLARVRNLSMFAGILVVDKWTCNSDGRQVAFWRMMRQRYYAAAFIDQGQCFNGGEWNFPDNPLRGVYSQNEVYDNILGWDSFEPWLSQIEDMSHEVVSEAAEKIPLDWYGGDSRALATLVRMLVDRRKLIRSLLTAFRLSCRRPFPNWGELDSESSGVA